MNEQTLSAAIQHHQSGRLAEAEAIYRLVLQREPRNAEAMQLLGALLFANGQKTAALEWMQRGLALDDRRADHHSNLGVVFSSMGRHEEAIVAYRRAIQLQPESPEAFNNLGLALDTIGRSEESIDALRRAVKLGPNFPDGWNNLGNALRKNGELDESFAAFQRAVSLRPDFADAIYNIGNFLHDRGQFPEAIAAYRRALVIRPDYVEALNNLSNVLRACDQLDLASETARKALALRPNLLEAKTSLGNALYNSGQVAEAIQLFREASALRATHSNLLLALHYSSDRTRGEIYQEHLYWNQQHARASAPEIVQYDNDRAADRKLRVGYVSCDFREHSVAFFIENLLTHHDPNLIETLCYADVPVADAVTERLRKAAHQWRDIVGLSDAKVAEIIRQDKIDILVDLAGHTGGNRLMVFARKPAPIQVTYLGYPDTTGLSSMDYRLTDQYADPIGEAESFHTEQLIRLPGCFLCYRPPANAPAVNALPALSSGRITFGSFNNLAKISDQSIGMWADILKQLPSSRLLMKSRGLSDPSPRAFLFERFAMQGIPRERLELRGRTPLLGNHLEQYQHVDIALDTFPYPGTTTTCESLWMGVPVITLAGVSHVQRVGVSLLTNINMPELIAQNPRDYVQKGVSLANDLQRLGEIRKNLREKMSASTLLDAGQFCRNVESAYRQMWEKWCESH